MISMHNNIGAPVLMGCGAVKCVGQKIKAMGCSKVLIIHDKNLKELGLLDIVTDCLKAENITFICFDGVVPDPPDFTVEAAGELARNEKVDSIIGFGGGSAIDTAKAANILISNPPPVQQYFLKQKLNPGVPSIYIPTTSGTGSEQTTFSVLTNTKGNKSKQTINNLVCLPTLAIVDPELTTGMPQKLTAAVGMDAFSHVAEAITCNIANPIVDAMSREAIRMIARNLETAVKNGGDLKARENMAYASTIAGIAFTNVRVHIGHSIAHVLGAAYHIPHGIGCAIAIVPVIHWAAKHVPEKVRMIGESLGCTIPENATPAEIGELTADSIRSLNRKIGIPTMRDLQIDINEVKKLLPLIKEQGAFSTRPGEITDQELLIILEEMYD